MGITTVLFATCLLAGGGTPSPRKDFAQIQTIVRAADATELQTVLPASAFDPWTGDEADGLRTALAEELTRAEVGKTTLKKVKGLPVAPAGTPLVKLQEKHTYLVHCQARRRNGRALRQERVMGQGEGRRRPPEPGMTAP